MRGRGEWTQNGWATRCSERRRLCPPAGCSAERADDTRDPSLTPDTTKPRHPAYAQRLRRAPARRLPRGARKGLKAPGPRWAPGPLDRPLSPRRARVAIAKGRCARRHRRLSSFGPTMRFTAGRCPAHSAWGPHQRLDWRRHPRALQRLSLSDAVERGLPVRPRKSPRARPAPARQEPRSE